MTLSRARLRGLAEKCLVGMRTLALQAQRITDKMPSNFMVLGLIHMLYPCARIVYCRRDPLDTCVSVSQRCSRTAMSFPPICVSLGYFTVCMKT